MFKLAYFELQSSNLDIIRQQLLQDVHVIHLDYCICSRRNPVSNGNDGIFRIRQISRLLRWDYLVPYQEHLWWESYTSAVMQRGILQS